MLFLELALIRWLGANVVHLSYFSNFVLLGSFLGIGLGFLISRRSWSLLPAAPVILALLVIGTFLAPVTIDRAGDDVIYFTSLSTTGPPAWLVLPVIFVLVARVLAGPAEVVGRCFADLRPLTAYRWDLVGSLLGIGAVHAAVVPARAVGGVGRPRHDRLRPADRQLAALPGARGRGRDGRRAAGGDARPRHLLVAVLQDHDRATGSSATRRLVDISVNGVPHQIMRRRSGSSLRGAAVRPRRTSASPDNPLDNVLIIGAGSGSDVAIALSKGAQHIDAVDIDPRIMEIGVEKNPDHPYADPRVTRHVNDGRAFLETTDNKYDLILFALPDSLALVTGASQIRLESFLFTEQALTAAREHLTPDGAFAMYNYYREDWLIDRLAGTAPPRLRAHPVRRHGRRRPGRGHGGARRVEPVLRDGVRARRAR